MNRLPHSKYPKPEKIEEFSGAGIESTTFCVLGRRSIHQTTPTPADIIDLSKDLESIIRPVLGHDGKQGALTGAYPGGRTPGGGASESYVLAPCSKVAECRPYPPPRPR